MAEHQQLTGLPQWSILWLSLCWFFWVIVWMWNDSRLKAVSPISFKSCFQKRARGKKANCILWHARWAYGQSYFPNTLCYYLLQAFSIPADREAVLLFWFVLGFFLTTSKLVNTVLGNKKWECLTLCGMWQQELVSASGEADSSSDTALVARSVLDKWGFVWILQYCHCSVLGGEMQYFRCLNTLPRWLQRPLPALQCDSASVHAAQNYTGIFCWPVAMPCPL